jgi:hypothetical protein
MNPKMPRPAAPGRAHRAANSKELPCTFDCQDSEAPNQEQGGDRCLFRTRTHASFTAIPASLLTAATGTARKVPLRACARHSRLTGFGQT